MVLPFVQVIEQKHPRVSGEYVVQVLALLRLRETPPRERGIQTKRIKAEADNRNTPA